MCLRSTVSHSHIILRTSLQPRQQLFKLSELWRSLLSSAADGERIHLSVCVNMCVYMCVFLSQQGSFSGDILNFTLLFTLAQRS